MTIFFYKGVTRNLEIGNTSVWVFSNIRRLGQVRDTKFGKNVSNVIECCKSFKSCWVVKKKNPTDGAGWGEGLKISPFLPPRLGLRRNLKKDRKWVDVLQKKPREVLCNKNCSEKFRKLPNKIPVLESLFNKGPYVCNFLKKGL